MNRIINQNNFQDKKLILIKTSNLILLQEMKN